MIRSSEARQALVSRLRREVAQLEAGRPPDDDQTVSTGSPALDRLLPAGGQPVASSGGRWSNISAPPLAAGQASWPWRRLAKLAAKGGR
jgi:hypothetical protein